MYRHDFFIAMGLSKEAKLSLWGAYSVILCELKYLNYNKYNQIIKYFGYALKQGDSLYQEKKPWMKSWKYRIKKN